MHARTCVHVCIYQDQLVIQMLQLMDELCTYIYIYMFICISRPAGHPDAAIDGRALYIHTYIYQDQLVIQMLQLMDELLKDQGLDLQLTPYRCLATAPAEGLVERVPDCLPLAQVRW